MVMMMMMMMMMMDDGAPDTPPSLSSFLFLLLLLHVIGQLKEGIREWVRGNRMIGKSQPAGDLDGGDAFTWLRLK